MSCTRSNPAPPVPLTTHSLFPSKCSHSLWQPTNSLTDKDELSNHEERHEHTQHTTQHNTTHTPKRSNDDGLMIDRESLLPTTTVVEERKNLEDEEERKKKIKTKRRR